MIQDSANVTINLAGDYLRADVIRNYVRREQLIYSRRNISANIASRRPVRQEWRGYLVAPDDPWHGDFEQVTMLVQQVT